MLMIVPLPMSPLIFDTCVIIRGAQARLGNGNEVEMKGTGKGHQEVMWEGMPASQAWNGRAGTV